jgi:hypothetical protein
MPSISKTHNDKGKVLYFGKKNVEKLLKMLFHVREEPKLAPLLGHLKCYLFKTHHSGKTQLCHFPDYFS